MYTNKHITFYINSLNAGGAERVLSNIANYWADKNLIISIVTVSGEKSFYMLNDKINLIQMGLKLESKNVLYKLYNHYNRIKNLIKIMQKNKTDILISFMTTNNFSATISAVILKIPVIISERNIPYTYTKSFIWHILYKLIYPKADYIVVQTQQIAEYFYSFCNSRKIKIIYNPLNIKLSTAQARKRENIILNVSRLEFQKGHDLLISAFSLIRDRNWKLVIIGEGSRKNRLINQIQEKKLEKYVSILGLVKNISDYYASASLFVLSSRYEGFPNVLCEAMASGLACISFNCPTGPSVIIKHNINGHLVESENTYKLAESINLLINNNEERKRLGNNAKGIINEVNIDKIMQHWDKLIEKLIDKYS